MTDLEKRAIGLGLDASNSFASFFNIAELLDLLHQTIIDAHRIIDRMALEPRHLYWHPCYTPLLKKAEYKKAKARQALAKYTRQRKNCWGETFKALNNRTSCWKLKNQIDYYFNSLIGDMILHQYQTEAAKVKEIQIEANEILDKINGWITV